MKYYRATIEIKDKELNFDLKDEISKEDFDYVQASIGELMHYSRARDLFLITIQNFAEFVYGNQKDFENHKPNVDWNHMNNLYININRRFINLLTSTRVFLDHTESFLKKKCGKDSKNVSDFKDLCSKYYDNSFSYRFFYKLRNYTLHCALPISEIRTNSTNDKINWNHTTGIYFNKKELLENFDSWSRIVKDDLEKQPEIINVNPLLKEFMEIIREIDRITYTQFSASIKENINGIKSLVYDKLIETQKPAIGIEKINNENKKEVSVSEIPLHIINKIEYELLNYYNLR